MLSDQALLDAVAAAAQLESANARLNAEVRAQIAELAASRRRILKAGDQARADSSAACTTEPDAASRMQESLSEGRRGAAGPQTETRSRAAKISSRWR